jgi:hypothetical protein
MLNREDEKARHRKSCLYSRGVDAVEFIATEKLQSCWYILCCELKIYTSQRPVDYLSVLVAWREGGTCVKHSLWQQ